MFSKVFRTSCRLWHNVENYCGASRATMTSHMAYTRYMLDKQGYKHAHDLAPGHPHARTSVDTYTHRQMNNTSCFFTEIFMQTRPNITLYVQCLSCYRMLPWGTFYVIVENTSHKFCDVVTHLTLEQVIRYLRVFKTYDVTDWQV
jgi:hypothetical protein